MKDPGIITEELPLEYIIPDANQPRKDLGIDEEDKTNRLLLSIRDFGLRSPIAVTKTGENRYRLIDGHRRYRCAQLLHWKEIRCEIHPESNEGELKRIRFDLQNNMRPWKTLERSQEVKEIRSSMNFKTNKELAEYLHFPENLLVVSLALQKKREEFQDLMDEYDLSEAYQNEFIRLEPKIRAIKEFDREQIFRNIFDRVNHKIIRSAKDFRKLGSIFLRAHANEKEIYKFLLDPDMRVDELAERTTRDGYVRDLEDFMKQTSIKISEGDPFPPEIKKILMQFRDLLIKSLD